MAAGPTPADGFTFEISGDVTVVDRAALGRDKLGPAVEIGAIVVREDGRASVPVIAGDRSGIARVKIFMDDKEIYSGDSSPWIWAGWPGKGHHTFYAVAQDDSPKHNERKSDAVTICIPKQNVLNED